MGKLIFFLLIIGAVYFLFFKNKKPIKDFKDSTENSNSSEDLIMCEKCKTFTPKNEILNINGKNICKDCYDNSK